MDVAVGLRGEATLFPWQEAALAAWEAGDAHGPYRGTLEIFTGGGKTLLAIVAFSRISALHPETKLAVIAPTEALARQWIHVLLERTTLDRKEIGLLGAGKRDSLEKFRVLVAVLNSAARRLPEMSATTPRLMLVVDEVHRAGAASFSKALDTRAEYRLGLSATPSRDEADESGFLIPFEQQRVGRKIGDTVYRFGLKEARETGWLPDYKIHHHGARLTDAERREYERITRKVNDAADQLSGMGVQPSQAWYLTSKRSDGAPAAQAYMAAVSARKDFLYRVSGRSRIAVELVRERLSRHPAPRILLFHERVAEAASLYEHLHSQFPDVVIVLEHSELPDKQRQQALARFRNGEASVLVSVKSLVEGIDVPDADVGISVASSSSVRQRIQTLGRVLRRRFDGGQKVAEMHVLYAHDTADELIYSKEDWSDLTGSDANRYLLWPLDPSIPPAIQPGPPLKPRPTEDMEWERLGRKAPDRPTRWFGFVPEYEFSVDVRGNVSTPDGAWIENPQGVEKMVEAVRGRPGGRFRITPIHNLVIVFGESQEGTVSFVAGKLLQPFRLRNSEGDQSTPIDTKSLTVGQFYPGPTDKAGGSYKIRQKRGGVIERMVGRETQFALTDADHEQSHVARRILSNWKSLGTSGLTISINKLGHVWYKDAGEPRFLGDAKSGFAWPKSSEEAEAKSSNSDEGVGDGERTSVGTQSGDYSGLPGGSEPPSEEVSEPDSTSHN